VLWYDKKPHEVLNPIEELSPRLRKKELGKGFLNRKDSLQEGS